MASGSLDFTAAVWQVSTGQMLYKYDFGKPIASLAFDPSGTMLVVSAGHKVFSWQFTRLAAPVKILKTRRSLRALHFHPTAPHILLTAEVTERRVDGGGHAVHTAVQQHPNPLNPHSQQQGAQQQPGGRGGAASEPDPQDAVDDLAAFIAAHNSMGPDPHHRLHNPQQQPQGDLGQLGGRGRGGGGGAATNQATAPAAWPIGLLRNLLTGVTGVFTGAYGGSGGGGGGGAGAGQQHGGGWLAGGARGATGSFASHGGEGPGGAAARVGAGGGGGAPSVNPGAYGTAHSSLPGTHGPAALHAGGGRLNVLAPADIVRHQSLGGGVRHAIPLVAPAALAAAPGAAAPAPAPRAARGGAPSGAGVTAPAAGGSAGGGGAPDPHVAAYDLTWGWNHSLNMSDGEIERVRQLALRAAPDLPSAANHDTPCIVTVRLWDFRDPTRELRKELLVLPRVVLCSEMGIHFSACGRYMVCCVVREASSEACMRWQAAQTAAVQAAAAAAATMTHAHPAGMEGRADAGLAEEGEEDVLGEEGSRGVVTATAGGAATAATQGSPGSCRSVEMADAEVRPRAPLAGGQRRCGGAAGCGEATATWHGGRGGDGERDATQEAGNGEGGRFDEDMCGDTATQACYAAAAAGAGAAAAWRGPGGGVGASGGGGGGGARCDSDGDGAGPADSVACGSASALQEQHTVELAARTAVSRPCAAAGDVEYDSADAATYRRNTAAAAAVSAISGVAPGFPDHGGGHGDVSDAVAAGLYGSQVGGGPEAHGPVHSSAAEPHPNHRQQGARHPHHNQQPQPQPQPQPPLTRGRARAPQQQAAAAGARTGHGPEPSMPAAGGGGGGDPAAATSQAAAGVQAGGQPAVQQTPSTFASIKAHLAMQRSRDGATGAVGGRMDTVGGPEANQAAAAAAAPAAAAAAGVAAPGADGTTTVAPNGTADGANDAATVAAPQPPCGSTRTCYELCVFYTGTSPMATNVNAPAAPAAMAAPSASSSVAFPAAGPADASAAAKAGGGASAAATIGPHFGALLHARPVLAAHCMTSVQMSPSGDHVLVAYGRRHISLCSLVACAGQLAAVHSVVEVYSIPDLVLRRVLLSADDEVNVAVFNAYAAEGMAYGTKEGRLRLIRYDRRPPLRSAIPFVPPPAQLDDELWEAEQQDNASMSVSEGEADGPAL